MAPFFDNIATGIGRAELLASSPSLRPEDIDAALAYAAELAREGTIELPRVKCLKFKIDENLSLDVGAALREFRFDIRYRNSGMSNLRAPPTGPLRRGVTPNPGSC